MLAAIRRHATGRNLLVMLAALVASAIIAHTLTLPAYRAVASGFDPFNVQYPLTWEMVAIQRGAFSPGISVAYTGYVIFDFLSQCVMAIFYALLWAWMMARSPQPLARNALLLFPALAVLFAAAENAAFLALVFSSSHDPRHDVTRAALEIHRIRVLLSNGNFAITVTLAVFTRYFRWRQKR